MPEIGTSGSMSGDGKRGVAEWRKLPRPSSTLPLRRGQVLELSVAIRVLRTWKDTRRRRAWTRSTHSVISLPEIDARRKSLSCASDGSTIRRQNLKMTNT
jgi:hypothetical protein